MGVTCPCRGWPRARQDVLALSPDGDLVKSMRRHGIEAHRALRMDRVFFQSGLNAVPKMAVHLLIAGAAPIRLFNIDLFISDRYPDGYKDKKSGDPRSYCWMFSRKYPSAQLGLLQALRGNGLIECDERLSGILDLETDSYMDLLEEKYGRSSW